MGKRIKPQRRGRGSMKFTAPSHRFKSKAHYRKELGLKGGVVGFEDDPSKTGVLMKIKWDDNKVSSYLAPEGIALNNIVEQGNGKIALGNILTLDRIPEGTPIFNVELKPGDGGRLARSSGSCAFIIQKKGEECIVRLPSKILKPLSKLCRATIGVAAGGGRIEKPLVKAGLMYHKMFARGHRYPLVRGVAMNPVSHPHGGTQHHAGKATTVKRGTPPGAKVGHIAARRTGRHKRK